MDFFGGIISIVSIAIYIGMLVHVVFAILTSLKVLKHNNKEKILLSLLTVWLAPIFGSIAVNKTLSE